jgi:hypothetical protein
MNIAAEEVARPPAVTFLTQAVRPFFRAAALKPEAAAPAAD